ncbi:hypothetical protein LCGC14_3166560, partial [marine sediment metagenome]
MFKSVDLKLQLVELLISSYANVDLSKVKIIGVQHILETTHSMFRSLYLLGLKPENIAIIGKCYSTCKEVFEEMLDDGIYVDPSSSSYCSHKSYDEWFSLNIENFLTSQIDDLLSGKYEKILVLDDGGKCIKALNKFSINTNLIVAIEQTTSGYEDIRYGCFNFPIINVARSATKLNIESPMIAQAASERLYLSLQRKGLKTNKVLIIGKGAIGNAMKNKFASNMEVVCYDRNQKTYDQAKVELSEIINQFPLILGCTGKISIPFDLHSKISPGTVLASVSS